VRLHDFLVAQDPVAARKAIETIFAATEILADFPEAGGRRPTAPQFREFPIRFGARGYVARYQVVQGEVYIIRVWHALESR